MRGESWESWAEELALEELFSDDATGTDAADDGLPEQLERNTECHPRKLLGVHTQGQQPPPDAGADCGTCSDGRSEVAAPSLQQRTLRTADKLSKKKFYAVAAGWRVGVFSKSCELRASTDGYKGARAKAFRTRAEAEKFVRKHTDPGVKHKGPAELRRRGSRVLRTEADIHMLVPADPAAMATTRTDAASRWDDPDVVWANAWIESPEPCLTATRSLEPVGDCPDEPAEHPKEWGCLQVVSWVRSRGIPREIAALFEECEVEGEDLLGMEETDLWDVGVTRRSHLIRLAHGIAELNTRFA